jgi:hypothetical protein
MQPQWVIRNLDGPLLRRSIQNVSKRKLSTKSDRATVLSCSAQQRDFAPIKKEYSSPRLVKCAPLLMLSQLPSHDRGATLTRRCFRSRYQIYKRDPLRKQPSTGANFHKIPIQKHHQWHAMGCWEELESFLVPVRHEMPHPRQLN